MDEPSQKMEALKKAYADIILNTAKEAAARVMVSERKALRFQQDLCFVKDESLGMLLRLKKMMDSKSAEAEIASLHQQKKIDELEAQLNEAEQIIVDLREELKQVQDELEKVNNEISMAPSQKILSRDVKFNTANNISSPDSVPIILASDMDDTSHSKAILGNCGYGLTGKEIVAPTKTHVDNSSLASASPDLASLIIANKKSDQYRNGCTQRVCALGSNFLDKPLPALHDHQLSSEEDGSIAKLDRKSSRKHTSSPHEAGSMDHAKKPTAFEDPRQPASGACVNIYAQPIPKRKRKVCCRIAKKSLRASCLQHFVEAPKPSSVIFPREEFRGLVNGNTRTSEGDASPALKIDKDDTVEYLTGLEEKMQEQRKTEVKCREGREVMTASLVKSPGQLTQSCASSSVLTHCKTYSHSVNGDNKHGEMILKMTENGAKRKTFSDLNLLASGPKAVSSVSEKDADLLGETVSVKVEHDSTNSAATAGCEMNPRTAVQSANSDLKGPRVADENNRASSQVDGDRILKYTFSRKRKKEPLRNHGEETNIDGRRLPKRRTGETNDGQQLLQASSLINDSSRDNRRLLQVARQLISLSGERWM